MKTRFDILAAASAVALGFGLGGLADAQLPPKSDSQLPQVKPVQPKANPPAQPSTAPMITNPQILVPTKTAVSLAPLVRAPLPGWADLHAHPASHLSFGADAGGNNGIFWGKPGLGLASSNPVADLPVCAPDKHGGFDADVVRHKTHQTVIGSIDNITGYTHGPNGAPDFLSWPNARSLTHQQMHVSMLKRAYDGGQRLMIASVTDNEFLSSLWSKIGYNAAGNQVPLHDPNFNIQSARRQLAFIKSFVAANPSWMEIALGAADARRIVADSALMWSQAAIISRLGGVIGLGTEGTSGMQPIINQPAIPQNSELVRFTGSFSTRAWTPARLVGNPVVSNLSVTIKTGGDDLRGGNNWAKARVTLQQGGATRTTEFDLSHGEKWDNDSTHTKSFALPPGTHANDIRSFALVTNPNGKNGPFDSPDNWNVDQLRVDATLAGVDTIGTWINEYKDILAAMHGRGVAIGTDMNGFAPQVPFSADAVAYPLTVAQQIHTWKARYEPPSLAQLHLGPTRTYNFQRDGLANYGMLADFMQAISQKPGGSDAITGLFRSANDVVEMWEKAEARKGHPFTVPPA